MESVIAAVAGVLAASFLLAAGALYASTYSHRVAYKTMLAARGLKGIRPTLAQRFRVHARESGALRALYLAPLAALGIPVAMQASLEVPANSRWAGGTPRDWCSITLKVKTVTNLRAGKFVIRDTTDEEIQVAGADAENIQGVLGTRNYTNPEWDPTTAPAAGDLVEVHLLGCGAFLVARNTANLLRGALVGSAAAGVTKALDTTKVQSCAGRVLKSHDGSGGEGDILIGGAV